jgi:hypothetical protein
MYIDSKNCSIVCFAEVIRVQNILSLCWTTPRSASCKYFPKSNARKFECLLTFFWTDDDVMSTLHRFRPSFLMEINRPRYLQPAEFHHSCLHHEVLKPEDMNPLLLEAENSQLDSQTKCAATPYVSPTDFDATLTVVALKALITEVCFIVLT